MNKILPLILLASLTACQKSVEQRPAVQYVGLNVRAFLQGAYDSTTDLMRKDLNQYGLLNEEQPFSGAPWFYQGSERMNSRDSNVVYWVLLEVWNQFKQVVGRKACLIRSDGTCVEPTVDGGYPQMPIETSDNQLYVVLKHLNHLSIRTPVLRSIPLNNVIDADFTVSNESSYNRATVWYGGRWCLRSGDANSDGVVKSNGPKNDDIFIRNCFGMSFQYRRDTGADLDMNGAVNSRDTAFLRQVVLKGNLSTIYTVQL